jgi:hypothetical protein
LKRQFDIQLRPLVADHTATLKEYRNSMSIFKLKFGVLKMQPSSEESSLEYRLLLASLLCLAAILMCRVILDIYFLLGAPVGDSILFLDSAHNLCAQGFLGTALVPLDPIGQNRYVWHGFLSPWLYGKLNLNCSVTGYFVVAICIKLISIVVTYMTSRELTLTRWQSVSACLVTLMVTYKVGFRPEPVAIILMLCIELCVSKSRHSSMAALASALMWTQPTVFGLYLLYIVFRRPDLIASMLKIGPILSFLGATAFLSFLYPFPVLDLLQGLRSHAAMISNRGDGAFWAYYGFTDFAPMWFFVFSFAFLFSAIKRPLLILLLPALWWFGPRLPPTIYNLLALLPIVLLHACVDGGRKAGGALLIGALLVAVVGLSQICLRDGATAYLYGRTLEMARSEMLKDANDPSIALMKIPDYGRLWFSGSGRLGTGPLSETTAVNATARRLKVNYYATSLTRQSPCQNTSPTIPSVYIFGKRIFNSTTSWLSYRCTDL